MSNVFNSEFLSNVRKTLTEKTEGGVSCTRAALADALGLEVIRNDGEVLATSSGLRVIDALLALGELSDFEGSRGRTGGLVRKGAVSASKASRAEADAAKLERKKVRVQKDLASMSAAGVTVEAIVPDNRVMDTSQLNDQDDEDLDVEIEDDSEDEILH